MIKHLLPLSSLLLLAACDPSAGENTEEGLDDDGGCSAADAAGCDEDGDGFKVSEGDCDDADSSVNPGITEICDGLDNNCDDDIDEGVTQTFYADVDEDGFGDDTATQISCEQPLGYVATPGDCDDTLDVIFPGNEEVCDYLDNNCNQETDEGVSTLYYADADADTYGDPTTESPECEPPEGYVTDSSDCDDTTGKSFPGNEEVCDEIDNNCDGLVDEGVSTEYWADFDADGYGNSSLPQAACAMPTGYIDNFDDCNDSAPDISPAASEMCDTLDNNCDGTIDEDTAADASTWHLDFDADTFGDPVSTDIACYQPSGYVADSSDCDDAVASTYPGAPEYCDGVDNNCDESIDEETALDAKTWYLDADSDAYGNPSFSDVECSAPTGFVADNTDCNDGSARAYPGATEYCDGIDNNCDSAVDEDTAADASNWYSDGDSDSYGDPAVLDVECYQPSGYVADNTDCDDARSATHPSATEFCNGIDDDCNSTIDDNTSSDAKNYYLDSDSDSYGNPSSYVHQCYLPSGYVEDNTDCDDGRAATNPGASEYCNAIDDDCDGSTDEDSAVDAVTWYRDADNDSYGDPSAIDIECYVPSGYVSDSTDCNDTSGVAHPGAIEVCDTIDNDCDGSIDEDGDVSDGDTFYLDTDADGFGDPDNTLAACDLPSGYADNYYDCDDGSATEPVVADAVSGSSAGTGTLSNPFDSLQDAIDDAYSCVVAYQGAYNETIDLSGKSIDLWGVEGASLTTIDGSTSTCTYVNPDDCDATVTIADGVGATAVVHGFTITGGSGAWTSSSSSTTCADSSASHSGSTTCTVTVYDYCGGGIYVNGDDPQLYDLVVTGNTLPDFGQFSTGSYKQTWMYSSGGGICVKDSVATFDLVDVEENYADQGGGVYGGGSAGFTYEHGVINENSATDGGGIKLEDGSGTFTNAAVICNDATTDGGGLFMEVSGTGTFVNTVFYKNSSSTSGGARGSEAWIGSSTTWTLYNSIVESNSAANSIYGAGTGDVQYSDVYNAAGSTFGGSIGAGSGSTANGGQLQNVKCDGNPANDNFTLKSGVAAIDAGNPDSAYNDVDGSRNDMGGYGGPGGSW